MINIISYKQYKNIRFFPGIQLAKKGQLVFTGQTGKGGYHTDDKDFIREGGRGGIQLGLHQERQSTLT